MKLSDEQIKSIMQKEGSSKTLLVDEDLKARTIEEHEKEGWKLFRSTLISSNKVRLTYTK